MMKLPAKVGVLVLDLLAAVLVLYSVSLIFLSNFNMGNLMVWLLTACVAGYAVFRRPLSLWFSAGAGRVVFWVLAVLAGVYLALIAFVSVSGYMNPPTGDERVIIVLGAGLHKDKPSKLLQCRLNKAYDYAAAHPDTLVITSGGQGRDEWRPEGDAMRDYLIAKGLPADRVLAESGSTSTEENFAFSLAILRQHGGDPNGHAAYAVFTVKNAGDRQRAVAAGEDIAADLGDGACHAIFGAAFTRVDLKPQLAHFVGHRLPVERPAGALLVEVGDRRAVHRGV